MLDLPSKIKDRNYVCMPVERMVIERDEEYSKCGKWILTNYTGSLLWIDEVWTKVQVLLENGTLIRIKVSTAAMKNTVGTVMCFTRPGIHEIKRAAEEIRKVVNYKSCMYYKINNVTENGINNRNGHRRVSIYMHTFKGLFYRNSATEGWVLENGTKNNYQRCGMSLEEKDKILNSGNELLSKSKELHFRITSNSLKQPKPLGFYIYVVCGMDEDEKGLTEADKLWVICKTLMNRGCIHTVTCYKQSATAEFRIFPCDTSNFMSFVKICDIIYNEADCCRFLYFMTSQKKKYRYSPEGELYENATTAEKYGFEKFIFSRK